jgi:hypothetical protein
MVATYSSVITFEIEKLDDRRPRSARGMVATYSSVITFEIEQRGGLLALCAGGQ